MANTWEEVSVAAEENRHELKLHGAEISSRIENNGLDEGIYDLVNLNYLDITRTCLQSVGENLGKLENLTNLVLHNNRLTAVPSCINDLVKLKLVDVSNNQIEEFPSDISKLENLHSLNASMNKLETFPDLSQLGNLHILNVSHNNFTNLPEGIFSTKLVHLSQIIASDNQIEALSSDVSSMPHLNLLDLSSNKLCDVPLELSECPKLKELDLKSNKFKDRRFGKLVEQCGTKQVLDYLLTLLKKERAQQGKKGKGKDKKKKGAKVPTNEEEVLCNLIKVLHFSEGPGVTVQVTPAVMSVRQYIVCCIVHNLDFHQSNEMFKHFITLQVYIKPTFVILNTHF